jgi:hypothetical protein
LAPLRTLEQATYRCRNWKLKEEPLRSERASIALGMVCPSLLLTVITKESWKAKCGLMLMMEGRMLCDPCTAHSSAILVFPAVMGITKGGVVDIVLFVVLLVFCGVILLVCTFRGIVKLPARKDAVSMVGMDSLSVYSRCSRLKFVFGCADG